MGRLQMTQSLKSIWKPGHSLVVVLYDQPLEASQMGLTLVLSPRDGKIRSPAY